MLRSDLRRLFDEILEQTIASLPAPLQQLLEEVPLIVEDRPSRYVLDEMHIDDRTTDLCGLHWGIPLTRRSVEHSATLPDRMMLFREPIFRLAGYRTARERPALEKQIRITLLHEMGHHFGLGEDDLARLGYA